MCVCFSVSALFSVCVVSCVCGLLMCFSVRACAILCMCISVCVLCGYAFARVFFVGVRSCVYFQASAFVCVVLCLCRFLCIFTYASVVNSCV